jgi:hypothetical protein
VKEIDTNAHTRASIMPTNLSNCVSLKSSSVKHGFSAGICDILVLGNSKLACVDVKVTTLCHSDRTKEKPMLVLHKKAHLPAQDSNFPLREVVLHTQR